MPRSLKWLTGLGLVGAFYVSGYIIEFAFQSLLGLIILDPANRIYLESASGFFFDLWSSALEEISSNLHLPPLPSLPSLPSTHMILAKILALLGCGPALPGTALLVVSLSLVGIVGDWFRPGLLFGIAARGKFLTRTALETRGKVLARVGLDWLHRQRWAFVFLLFVVGSVLKLLWFDLPLASLPPFLANPQKILHQDQMWHPVLFKNRGAALRTALVCSHLASEGIKYRPCQGKDDRHYRRVLERNFLASTVVTLALTALGIGFLRRPVKRKAATSEIASGSAQGATEKSPDEAGGTGGLLDALILAALFVTAVGALLFYGKTVRTFAERRYAEIHYDREAFIEGIVLPATSPPEGDDTQDVSLLNLETMEVWTIPKENITMMIVGDEKAEIKRYKARSSVPAEVGPVRPEVVQGIPLPNSGEDVYEVYVSFREPKALPQLYRVRSAGNYWSVV